MPLPLQIGTARSLLGSARPFRPDQWGGLLLWLRADSISGGVDGTPIATWKDGSGQGNDVVQATAAKQGVYKTDIVNGRPVVRFDGVDDVMSTSSAALRPLTLFAVANWTNGTTFTDYSAIVDLTTISNDVGFVGDGSGSTILRMDNASIYRINGVSAGIFTPMSAFKCVSKNVSTPGTDGMTVGKEPYGAGRYWEGDVAEVIAYSTSLSVADMQRVERYLSVKYGLGF